MDAARRGSTLILAIVLLILLGLLSATFLSTSRRDRIISAQHVADTNADIMLDGICKVAEGVIVDDLNDGFGNLRGDAAGPGGANQSVHCIYRGAYVSGQQYFQGDIVSTGPSQFFVALSSTSTAPSATGSTSWRQTTHLPGITCSLAQPWLADRIPTPDGVSGFPAMLAYWPNITQMPVPVGSNLPTSILGTPFESPDGTAMPTLSPGSTTLVGKSMTALVPDFEQLAGAWAPTLHVPGASAPLVAGDADGDGIADSLLFRIPGANDDGLTWYAAVRIIDNNSAINLSTALSRDTEYTVSTGVLSPTGDDYYGLFQTDVGLAELLNPGDLGSNFTAFNAYRIGSSATISSPQADAVPGGANPLMPVGRSDFQFLSLGDSFYQQLIRRIANPGFNGSGSRFQPLPVSDGTAVAYRFCLVNPQATVSHAGAGVSESLLPYSLMSVPGAATQYYRSVPYGNSPAPSSTDVNQWFKDNFNYDRGAGGYGGGAQPVRPLVVVRNPVSNAINPVYDSTLANTGEPVDPFYGTTPDSNVITGMMLPYGFGPPNFSQTHFKGAWNQSATYQFNDIVLGGDGNTYIYVATPGSTAPASGDNVAPTIQNLLPKPTGHALYKYWQFQPWTTSPAKANVNTATFRELYRAFWSVMAGNPSNQTPFGNSFDPNPYDCTLNPQRQFRSPLRDPTWNTAAPSTVTRLDSQNTMLLRAAIAAVNAMGLRDASQNIVSRTIYLNAEFGTSTKAVMARVYSNAPQPVISEVYASGYRGADGGNSNYEGYVAVELYNPYSVPMYLNNWQLGLVTRTAANYPNLSFAESPGGNGSGTYSVIAPPSHKMIPQNDPRIDPSTGEPFTNPPSAIVIPPLGYALLENYNPANANQPTPSGDAAARPATAGFQHEDGTDARTGIWTGPDPENPNTCDVYVPGLQAVIQGTANAVSSNPSPSPGGELELLRPRRADGQLSSSDDPLNTFNEGTADAPNLYDLVPVDSFDFTGLTIGTTSSGYAWSYRRPKGGINSHDRFRQFYPGRYVETIPREGRSGTDIGTDTQLLNAPVNGATPAVNWNANAAPAFGSDVSAAQCSYTDNFPPIQMYSSYRQTAGPKTIQVHWPNPTWYLDAAVNSGADVGLAPALTTQSPYGTFARNGDLLDIPFIGAYRISLASDGNAPTRFVELNSLPRDCSTADATYADAAQQRIESIGRFCPTSGDAYGWTSNLFSYLTVQSSTSAFLPDFDPNINDATRLDPIFNANPTPAPPFKYGPSSVTTTPPAPTPAVVLTTDPTAPGPIDEGSAGVEGLVNINTACWKVLSMLPMITKHEDQTGVNYATDNEKLAKAIVTYRLTHGPFMSIDDLNNVPGFQTAEGNLDIAKGGTVGGVSTFNGLLCPPDPSFPSATGISSGVDEDYQSDSAMLSRISNLITTRSDTFTVYVEIQGWQNAGTSQATPVVTRRYAFITDRSGINMDPRSRFLKNLAVPTQ